MKIEINNIYNIDCIKGMKRIDEKLVDIIVTSPPYNIGVKYGKHNDNLPFTEYLDWMDRLGFHLNRVLKDNGSLFLI